MLAVQSNSLIVRKHNSHHRSEVSPLRMLLHLLNSYGFDTEMNK